MSTTYKTREEWLTAATEALRPMFRGHGHEVPPVRVSCGWPSTGGTSTKKRTLGQCWDKKMAADNTVPQIFISPWLSDLVGESRHGVLPTLVHELVHAVFGCEESHGKKFGKLARELGLEGRLTATTAGDDLAARLEILAKELGDYPHSRLDLLRDPKTKKQTTRMVKCECPECGYVCRTTRTWLDKGTPLCPCGGDDPIPMKVRLPDEAPEEQES